MNRLVSSALASDPNQQQPLPIASVVFLQDSVSESLINIILGIIGSSYDIHLVYVFYGCVKTVGGGNDSFTAGAIFYFGNILSVPAASFTTGTDYAYILQTNPAPDPILLKDGTSTNVHNVYKVIISGTAASGGSQTAIPNFSAWVPINEDWNSYAITNAMLNPGSGTITVGATAKFMYLKKNKIVYFQLLIVGATVTVATVDSLLIDLSGLFGAGILDTAVFHGIGSAVDDSPMAFDADIYDFSGAIFRCNFNVGLTVGSANRNIYCNGHFAIK